MHRCPNVLATKQEFDAINAALLVEQQGVLPGPGGWLDQSATFVAAYPSILREIGHWRSVHQEVERKRHDRR